MDSGENAFLDMADRCILHRRGRTHPVRHRKDRPIETVTNSVMPGSRWQKLHIGTIWSIAVIWSGFVATLGFVPNLRNAVTRGLALGFGAMLPHIWLGMRLWHDPKRTGIGIPIAVLALRLIGSVILFSIFLWQFPTEQRIIAWSGSTLIIVFTAIEAFFFAKGVGRL